MLIFVIESDVQVNIHFFKVHKIVLPKLFEYFYLFFIIIILVESDYYVSLWRCLYFPQIDGKWSSWNDKTITINKRQCNGNLIYSTRKCDSPSPKYCGLTCGEHFIKVDIIPGFYFKILKSDFYFGNMLKIFNQKERKEKDSIYSL